MLKAVKKDMKEKASSDSRKEAKRLAKEGWKTMGGMPLDKQLDDYAGYENLSDDYIVAEGYGSGMALSSAQESAIITADAQLVRNMQSKVAGIYSRAAVNRLDGVSAGTDTTRVKAIAAGSIERITTVIKRYRQDKKTGKFEVYIARVCALQPVVEKVMLQMESDLKSGNAAANKELDDLLNQ